MIDRDFEGTTPGAPDDADKSSMGNNSEIEIRWGGVIAAYRAGGRLAEQRDEGVRRELEEIARLYVAVTGGSNDPEILWWRFLDGKGVRRGKRRGKRLLFYALIEHLSNEHASQDETRSKSIISRRAAVLQHWQDQERVKVPANQLAEWIANNGGVKAVAAIANPRKPPMTEAEREAARDGRKESFRRLVDSNPLGSMSWDVLPDNLRPLADGTYRLALIRVRTTEANAGAVDIIGMADDSSVSQRWLDTNAQEIVERLTAADRDCEAAEDSDASSFKSKVQQPHSPLAGSLFRRSGN